MHIDKIRLTLGTLFNDKWCANISDTFGDIQSVSKKINFVIIKKKFASIMISPHDYECNVILLRFDSVEKYFFVCTKNSSQSFAMAIKLEESCTRPCV